MKKTFLNRFFSLSVRDKFLIPTLLAVFLGLSLSSGIIYNSARQSIENVSDKDNQLLSETVAIQTNNLLQEIRLSVEGWTKDALFRKSISSTHTNQSVRGESNRKFKELIDVHTYIEYFALANTQGVSISSDNDLIPGNLIVNEKDFFHQSLQGKTVISSVFESGLTGKPVFVISTPVKSLANKIDGVLIAAIRMNHFNEQSVIPINAGELGYAFIYDNEGIVIAHEDPHNILDMNLKDLDYGREMLKSSEGNLSFQDEEGSKYVSFHRIQESDWTLAVVSNRDDILGPITQISFTALVLTFIITLCVGVIFFNVVESIIRPIKQVAQLTDGISKGELPETLPVYSLDEVGRLVRSFNEMVDSLMRTKKENEIYKENIESKNEELTQFAYRTSHDLKAPLSTTKGLLKFMLDDLDSGNLSEVKQNAETASKQIAQLESLVVDLLNMAKMDIAEQRSNTLIDFSKVVKEIELNLSELAKKDNVEIISTIETRRNHYFPRVIIAQVLENLISNSIKYCDKNKERPFVKIAIQDTDAALHMKVEDNGIGFTSKDKDDVYGLFKRLHSKESWGSGLGMYIVKKI